MTPTDLRLLRARLRLTQEQAASTAGVNARTWRKWELGERSIPTPVARLLLLIEAGLAPRQRKVLEEIL